MESLKKILVQMKDFEQSELLDISINNNIKCNELYPIMKEIDESADCKNSTEHFSQINEIMVTAR
ncbi:MAG: hypothetical protein JZU55_15325 [Afipia sp.]|nr:hypothetical protein [Afipia sp.]